MEVEGEEWEGRTGKRPDPRRVEKAATSGLETGHGAPVLWDDRGLPHADRCDVPAMCQLCWAMFATCHIKCPVRMGMYP